MTKIYLTDDKRQAVIVRNLLTIDIFNGLLTMGYIMPAVSEKETDAVQCIKKYCKKNLAERLKTCEFFAVLPSKEDDEETDSHNVSMITKATLGMLCVFADQAEMVLAELQRLGICKTIQEALKTGKHVLLV